MSYDAFDGRILACFTFGTPLGKAVCRGAGAFWPASGPNCSLSWGVGFDGLFNKLKESNFISGGGLWEKLQAWRSRQWVGCGGQWKRRGEVPGAQSDFSFHWVSPNDFPKALMWPCGSLRDPREEVSTEGHRIITWPGRFIAFMEIRFAVLLVSYKVEVLNQSHIGK